MSEPSLTIKTHSAHWGWDDHRYFGFSVFEQLTGHESMVGMTALSALGRRLSKECCDVLDDIVCTSTLADPRIWPLKLTRLVASYGGTTSALAAGLMIQEGARVGPWVAVSAAQALIALQSAIGASNSSAEVLTAVKAYLTQHRFISGFGTPFRKYDERLVAFRKCMRRRQRDRLPYWTTMELVTEAVRILRGVKPNIGLGIAAAMLDMEVAPDQIGALGTALAGHMFLAHAADGARHAEALLRELPSSCVSYVGAAPRRSPLSTVGMSFIRHTGEPVRNSASRT